MLRAIYEAASREAQERNQRAFERQQRTQQEQERRIGRAERHAHNDEELQGRRFVCGVSGKEIYDETTANSKLRFRTDHIVHPVARTISTGGHFGGLVLTKRRPLLVGRGANLP